MAERIPLHASGFSVIIPHLVSPPSQSTPAAAPGTPCIGLDARDPQWFAKEVYPHDGNLKAYLRGSFPSVRDVDDVVQESYVRVWRRQLRGPMASARSLLYKIARNLAIDALRRAKRSPIEPVADLAELNILDGQPSAAEAACSNEEIELLLAAIESLPPRCREVVVLRKLAGLSPQEIAHRLGMSEGTVHIHGAKGVRRCEAFLRARGLYGKGEA